MKDFGIKWHNEKRPIKELVEFPDNPRQITSQEAQSLKESLRKFGLVEPLAINIDNEIIGGHQRKNIMQTLLLVDPDYQVDVRVPERKLSPDEVLELNIRLNKNTAGWDWDKLSGFEVAKLTDWGFYKEDIFTWRQDAANLSFMLESEEVSESDQFTREQQLEAIEKGRNDERAKNVDLIFTVGSGGVTDGEPKNLMMLCCIACKSGWKYGFNSDWTACAGVNYYETHKVAFVDNWYKHYDHEKHLRTVKRWRPKYCTVCDVMSEVQCAENGMEYQPLEQILDWAEELSEYAENVMVIPKYDCIDRIPEKFMLGYSVPTSHGGTPLPIEAFRGRRIHLLGGSPNKQITFWQALPDDVVSLDNNYIMKSAKYGSVWMEDGSNKSLTQLGLGVLTNPLYVALTITLGNMAGYFRQKGGEDVQIEEKEQAGTD